VRFRERGAPPFEEPDQFGAELLVPLPRCRLVGVQRAKEALEPLS
jgi:hypothetical protein